MYRVASAAPIQKVTATGLAALITTILFWLLHEYAHVDLPAEVASAVTGVIALLVAYVTPLAPGDVEPIDRADGRNT